MSTATTSSTVVGLPLLLTSWKRHMRAANLAPRTIQSYLEAATQLVTVLDVTGTSTDPSTVTRTEVESFIVSRIELHSASTAANRYRSLQQLLRWLCDEGEITTSPMDGMRPPRVPDQPVSIYTMDELTRLLGTCREPGWVRLRVRSIGFR